MDLPSSAQIPLIEGHLVRVVSFSIPYTSTEALLVTTSCRGVLIVLPSCREVLVVLINKS